MMKAVALLLSLIAAPSFADPLLRQVPLGYQQISSPSVATNLTPPAGATTAVITVETQAVRYRDDGVAPTSSIGQPLAVTGASPPLVYSGNLSAIQFIQQVAGAVIDVSYYR